MDDFHFNIPEIDTTNVRRSYESYVNAHANLKKARRRVRIIRSAEIALVALGGVMLYNHFTNREDK
jgi:hypothetical protein